MPISLIGIVVSTNELVEKPKPTYVCQLLPEVCYFLVNIGTGEYIFYAGKDSYRCQHYFKSEVNTRICGLFSYTYESGADKIAAFNDFSEHDWGAEITKRIGFVHEFFQ